MNTVSRADVLRTLHQIKDADQSSISSTVEKALARQFGFSYNDNEGVEPSQYKQELTHLNPDIATKNNADMLLSKALVNQRYWYINYQENVQKEEGNDKELFLSKPVVLESKKATLLPSVVLKSNGEWQNLFDLSLKQAQTSKQIDLKKSILHLSKSRPADNLPNRKTCGFNKTVCIIMERKEALRPVWGDMRDIWLNVKELVGYKNLLGYYLPAGIQGSFQTLNNQTPKNIESLEASTLLIYIGDFGALHTGDVSTDWQQHIKQQQRKGHNCHLYSLCPIKQSPVKHTHQLDQRTQHKDALTHLLDALRLVWIINDSQLRYLRNATRGATLQTELLAFNHKMTEKDAQYIWHKHDIKSKHDMTGTRQLIAKKIAKKASSQWRSNRSNIAIEMENFLIQLHAEKIQPKIKDYPFLQNLAVKSHQFHQSHQVNNLSLSVLRSVLPDLEALAQRPSIKDWQDLLRVAQQEAINSGLPLPLRDEGLASNNQYYAHIIQQNSQLQLASIDSVNSAQKLLTIGDQAYCEESNRIISKSIPSHKVIQLKDQGMQYQISSMKKPKWASRIWHNSEGLHAAHQEGSEFLLKPASQKGPSAQWQVVYKAWAWAGDYGVDQYGLWANLQLSQTASMKMRWIVAGDFLMGSPEDEKERFDDEVQHEVSLTQGYWLAETSVTQAQWMALMDKNPSEPSKKDYPVNNISWDDCQVFISRLKKRMADSNPEDPDGRNFNPRLPSEAEWERACRANTKTAYWWGDKFDKSKVNNSSDVMTESNLPQNPFGLRSMSGNVYEWCNDGFESYNNNKQAVKNPIGATDSIGRVVRGGCWTYGARNLRSAYRDAGAPGYRYRHFGFRLAGGFDPQASKRYCALTADRRALAKPVRRQSTMADKIRGFFK